MKAAVNFYLSQLIGKRITLSDGGNGGTIRDIVVDLAYIRPKVVGVEVKQGQSRRLIDFSTLTIVKARNRFMVFGGELQALEKEPESKFYLMKHIQDKQIVDMNDRKLERVNDVRLASLSTGTFVVAVDVGLEGLLRRLGVGLLFTRLAALFRASLPSRLILWDDVEAINLSTLGIKLSKAHSKLSTLHSSDLADIIEDLDNKSQAAVFAALDEAKAADVLEELEADAQVNILESLPVEKAADMLEKMPADEVADILDELHEEKAEEILDEMDNAASEEVRELMEYPDDTVGSLMTTDFISFNENMNVDQILGELRRLKPESDTIYYLYILDDEEHLVATVSLRDIVISDPHVQIRQLMSRQVIFVKDNDPLDSLGVIISKYNLLALPVVDPQMKMVGMVIIDDIVFHLLKSRKRKI